MRSKGSRRRFISVLLSTVDIDDQTSGPLRKSPTRRGSGFSSLLGATASAGSERGSERRPTCWCCRRHSGIGESDETAGSLGSTGSLVGIACGNTRHRYRHGHDAPPAPAEYSNMPPSPTAARTLTSVAPRQIRADRSADARPIANSVGPVAAPAGWSCWSERSRSFSPSDMAPTFRAIVRAPPGTSGGRCWPSTASPSRSPRSRGRPTDAA